MYKPDKKNRGRNQNPTSLNGQKCGERSMITSASIQHQLHLKMAYTWLSYGCFQYSEWPNSKNGKAIVRFWHVSRNHGGQYWSQLVQDHSSTVIKCSSVLFQCLVCTCVNRLWSTIGDFWINWLRKILPPRRREMKNNLIFICSVNIYTGIRIPTLFE